MRATSRLYGLLSIILAINSASAQAHTPDCLGPEPIVAIEPGRIGALTLDLSIAEIQRRCPTMRWTATHGDERLDTAIVLKRNGLEVVGSVAVIGDEEGFRPFKLDTNARVTSWKVSGTAAVLPDGVSLTATWADLRRAYGPLNALALNGTVYVDACRKDGLRFLMSAPNGDIPLNGTVNTQRDSVMAKVRITSVIVSSAKSRPHIERC